MKKLAMVTLLLLSMLCRGEAHIYSSKNPLKESTRFVYSVNTKRGNPIARKSVEIASNRSILEVAENMLGTSSRHIPGCDSGRLACAAMVSRVLTLAGITDVNSTCTSDLNRQLSKSQHFKRIKIKDAQPGDIIISPSNGRKYGHVGIVGKNGKVYSNNSLLRRFDSVFTLDFWRFYFPNQRDLAVIVYRRI